MGFLHLKYFEDDEIYGCNKCKVHLTQKSYLNSKRFTGKHGKAYLFNKVINISDGPMEDRELLTGLHTCCDVYCNNCESILGWKYERAFNLSEQYKEGKIILERALITKIGWV